MLLQTKNDIKKIVKLKLLVWICISNCKSIRQL